MNMLVTTNQQISVDDLKQLSLPQDVISALTTLLKRVPHKIEASSKVTSVWNEVLTITFGDGSSLRFYGEYVEVDATGHVDNNLHLERKYSKDIVSWLPQVIRSLEDSGMLSPLYYIGIKETGLTIVKLSDTKLAELPEDAVYPEGFETEEDALNHIKNIDLDELARENPLAAVYMKKVVNTIDQYQTEEQSA